MLLSANSGVDSIVQLITVLLIFVFVLAVTLWVTKWIAGFQRQQSEGKNIQIIETTKISPNHYAQIMKVGDKYVAVAIGKENVTVLATLDESQLNLDASKQPYKNDFASVFKKIIKDKSDNVNNEGLENSNSDAFKD